MQSPDHGACTCEACRTLHIVGNRHHAKRWLRAFAPVAAVASDALEADQPSRCFALLCEHITLEDALYLAYGRPPSVPTFDIADAIARDGFGVALLDQVDGDRVIARNTPIREYTSMEDVERDFGTSSREYEGALAIMTQGSVYMESETPLEVGDLVAASDQPNRVRFAELEDRVVGRVEGVTVSGTPAGTSYLALVRLGTGNASQQWTRAVAAAWRRLNPVSARFVPFHVADLLLDAALVVARRWDPDVTAEVDVVEERVRGNEIVIQLRAQLFGESVYVTVNT